MKELFKVLKDHKNPFMEDLVNSSYQYCFRDELESFVGDAGSVDLDECGTENVVRVWLVDPSFHSSLSWALRKLQDAKLVIDQFGFQLDGTGIHRGNETVEEQARLSDKLTVLVNDIGIAMKRLGYALYGGKVYKKCDKAKYTYSYKCEVEAFVNSLAANELFKARLLKDMKKVIVILANPHCEVIRPLCVDYNLIEVNEGQCWSIKGRRFLENAIEDKDIGHVTPRAFSPYDPTKEAEPKYFKEILENSLPEAEIEIFCEDFLRLLNHNKKRHKDKVPCLIGAANSGKTSLFQPLLGLVHHSNIASITKQRVFNKAMINRFTELIFIDEACPSTLDIDDWKILTQGGYTACDVKYQTAKSFINRCPMLLTAQQKLEFKPEDQPAMDRRLRNYTFTSLPRPKKKATEWLRKHPMDCVVWASTIARPPSDQDESSDGSLEEDQASQNGDGILNDKEKGALRTLTFSEDLADPLKETGEMLTTVEESSGDGLDSDEDQCTSNLRKALELSSSGSLRHRQISSILQTRVREKEEQIAREQQLHQLRRDSLVARGVPREHADLLPRNSSDPLPTQLKDDLATLRQKAIDEEKETRKRKAKEAFKGRWLRETEKELYDCVQKSHRVRDPYLSANMEAYIEILCDKLKNHHRSLGTYNTVEAIEERRRACVDLGILRQEDQHLVKCVQGPLPAKCELEEVTWIEAATESGHTTLSAVAESSDDESMFLTPIPSTAPLPARDVAASIPDDCAMSDELLRAHSTKRQRCRSQSQKPNKRSKRSLEHKIQNTILNYYPSQKN